MSEKFCDDSPFKVALVGLIAEEIIGKDRQEDIEERYREMVDNWDTEYDDEKEIYKTIKLGSGLNSNLPTQSPGFGCIGVDLPTWFNCKQGEKRVMIVAQDPRREKDETHDTDEVVLSSPFGLHFKSYREGATKGLRMNCLVEELVGRGYGVYLTDYRKYFFFNHKVSDKICKDKEFIKLFKRVLKQEIDEVSPSHIVTFGNVARRSIKKLIEENGVDHITFRNDVKLHHFPHISFTANGAWKRLNGGKFSYCLTGDKAEIMAQRIANEII